MLLQHALQVCAESRNRQTGLLLLKYKHKRGGWAKQDYIYEPVAYIMREN